MVDYTKIPTDVLFEHVHTHALEHCDSFESMVDEEVEWSLSHVDDYEECDPLESADGEWGVRFHCETEGKATQRVSRGSRMHPPEYETEHVPIYVDITWYPSRNTHLGGVEVYVEGGHNPFAPDVDVDRYTEV